MAILVFKELFILLTKNLNWYCLCL